MTNRRAPLIALVAAAMAATAILLGHALSAQAPRKPSPSFRSAVDMVSLNVTAMDPTNHYVTDLEQPDFSIFEDGVKQEVTFFNQTQLPIALALLIDTSASMEDKIATAQEAAIGFAKRLRSEDEGEVIDFDSRVEVLQKFTNDVQALEKAIRQTAAGGSTSLYNAIYISLKELKKALPRTADEIRRQAIVLLSDGEDTSSLVSFEEVLDLAKRSETAIYAIALRGARDSASRGFKEAEFVMRQLTQETGGRVFFPTNIGELSNIYGQIAAELASQYTIGYVSKNARRDGLWRRVVVRVARPNVTTRTKQGYFAGATN